MPKLTEMSDGVGAGFSNPSPFVLWFTGLPGSGKSTLATALANRLRKVGIPVAVLDGDGLRQGLCQDLGFTVADRHEQARRAMQVAHLLFQNGIVGFVALISPFRQDRERARALFPPGRFLEIYLDCPREILQARDPKGLWHMAQSGQLKGLTGWDAPYEVPTDPDLVLATGRWDVESTLGRLVAALDSHALLPRHLVRGLTQPSAGTAELVPTSSEAGGGC